MKTYKPGQIITLKGGVKLRAIHNPNGLCKKDSGEACYFYDDILNNFSCSKFYATFQCHKYSIIFRRIK